MSLQPATSRSGFLRRVSMLVLTPHEACPAHISTGARSSVGRTHFKKVVERGDIKKMASLLWPRELKFVIDDERL